MICASHRRRLNQIFSSKRTLLRPVFSTSGNGRSPDRLGANRSPLRRVVTCVTIARRVLGALLFLTGVVWIGQGVSVISGSSMTGSTFWAVVGALCAVAGLVLLGWPWRQSHADT